MTESIEWIVLCKSGGALGGFTSKEDAEAWPSEHPEEAEAVICGPAE